MRHDGAGSFAMAMRSHYCGLVTEALLGQTVTLAGWVNRRRDHGGVIEAAVRTAYEIQTKKTLPKLDFTELRGLAGIRSATIDFDGVPVKIGIAHGLGNARRLVEEIRAGRSPYHAIEIMACPGGCINGGGQPYHRGNEELLKRRAEALYAEDAAKPLRKSHENPDIQALYEEFLGEPCGPLSHELLHTRYYDRKPVVEPKK